MTGFGIGLGLGGFASTALVATGLTGAESDGTQLLLTPYDVPSTWVASSSTLTANAAVAPDGTTTAASAIEDTGSLGHKIRTGGANYGSTGSPFTFSAYLKAAGRRYVSCQIGFVEVYAVFDLQTGTVSVSGNNGGNGTLASASVAVGANGFFKCIISWTTTNTFTEVNLHLQTAGTFTSGGQNYTGDGTSGIYFWRPKLTQP